MSAVGRQSDPQSGGQQTDPRSDRPARAGWAALRQFRFRDIPLGANAGAAAAAAPAARCELRGIAKPAALKDQAFRAALASLALISRARGPRRPSDVGEQSDPQTERPAPAAWAAVGRRRHFVLAEFVLAKSGWGER